MIDGERRAKSLKGIPILWTDPVNSANFGRDSEKFYNPKITKVSCTLDGNPNQLFASGMKPHQFFDEIRKHFADGKHRINNSVAKEIELADVSLPDYLTTKFGLWLDMRSSDDDTLHGSGRRIEGDSQSIQIEIEKKAETAGALNAYVFYIQDAQINF